MSIAWAVGAWANLSWVGMNAGPPNAWRGASTVVTTPSQGGGTSKKKHGRVIRYSDLDAREREEALREIPVRPFTPIEAAAAKLALAHDENAEDDEIILLALIRTLH